VTHVLVVPLGFESVVDPRSTHDVARGTAKRSLTCSVPAQIRKGVVLALTGRLQSVDRPHGVVVTGGHP
jgi:hypothetical protein